MEEIKTKVCPKCGRELSVSKFYSNRRAKDGLATYCKECANAISTECARKRRERKKAEAKENERIEFEKKYTELKQTVRELTAKLEGKPVAPTEEKMKSIRKRFAKLKDRKEIMLGMGFPYDESSPIAYNEVVFLEWAKKNGKWEEISNKI